MSELDDLRAEVKRLRHEVYVHTSTEDGRAVFLEVEVDLLRSALTRLADAFDTGDEMPGTTFARAVRDAVEEIPATSSGAAAKLRSDLDRATAELAVLRQHVAEEAARPVMVIDFDEAADVWCGTCPEHGEIVRTADDTADAHDEVVVALARHSHTEHGDDALVPLDMLAVPDALDSVRRADRKKLVALAHDAWGVIANAENFKHTLVCEHGRGCPEFEAHSIGMLVPEPIGPQGWRDAAHAWRDRFHQAVGITHGELL